MIYIREKKISFFFFFYKRIRVYFISVYNKAERRKGKKKIFTRDNKLCYKLLFFVRYFHVLFMPHETSEMFGCLIFF